MSGSAIVVVGSLHHDVMVEAPRLPVTGETLTGTRWYPKFGGKGGNQALAVHHTGAELRLLASVGDDSFGSVLLDTLRQHGVATDYIERLRGIGSGMSVALVDEDGDYAAVIVSGANTHTDPKRLDDASLWNGAKLLLLQNEVPEALNVLAATRAKAAGLLVCLNAAPARQLTSDFESLIDLLVVNAIEAEMLTGIAVRSMTDALAAASSLNQRFKQVVVTAGSDGAALGEQGADSVSIDPVTVEVTSTHGAGDVFTGTLCAELTRGSTLLQAAREANAAAARHVSTP